MKIMLSVLSAAMFCTAFAISAPYWEDETVSRVNTLAPRDELIPFATREAAEKWADLEAERETSILFQ